MLNNEHLHVIRLGPLTYSLYMLQQYAMLVALDDSLKASRLHYFLVVRTPEHEAVPGLAGMLQVNRGSRQPWRRLALFRLLHIATRDNPEVVYSPFCISNVVFM